MKKKIYTCTVIHDTEKENMILKKNIYTVVYDVQKLYMKRRISDIHQYILQIYKCL